MEKDNDYNQRLYEAVLTTLPPNSRILYLCLTGSRGKNLNSHEADYDVRVIMLYDLDTYILQEAKGAFKINPTTFEGSELEGQAIDLFTAVKYASETNFFIREIFRAPMIYQEDPEIIEKLKDLYKKCYNSFKPLDYLNGQLRDYIKKGVKNEHWKFGTTAPCKSLAEIYHGIFSLREIYENKEFEFSYSIESLYKYAGQDEETAKKLVEIRRVKKNEPIELTTEIKNRIDEEYKIIHDKLMEFRNKGEPKEIAELRAQYVPEAKAYFLEYARKRVLQGVLAEKKI